MFFRRFDVLDLPYVWILGSCGESIAGTVRSIEGAIEGYSRNRGFPNMMDLMTIVDGGVPVDRTGTGDLQSAL